MKRMKNVISGAILAILALGSNTAQAQWSGVSPLYTYVQVGIGTATPSAQLEVRSQLYPNETPNGLATARLYGHLPPDVMHPNTENIFEAYTVIDAATPIATRQFMIDFNGNVGIGINSGLAGQKLHVQGAAAITERLGVGTTGPLEKFQIGDRFTIHDGGSKVIGYNYHYDNGQGQRIVNDEVAMLVFDDNGSVSIRTAGIGTPGSTVNPINAFWVRNDGRVGIGTSSPGAGFQLDVAGKMRACEVLVENPGWCDYVFEDNYELRPLAEVEQFIKANKHLPEVPSEAEVFENGVELGEMNAVLLKKIEELTLYVIAQQKEIEALKATGDQFNLNNEKP